MANDKNILTINQEKRLSDEALQICGRLLMLDNTTPHVNVPVQLVQNREVIATVLSDDHGFYRFDRLKRGDYQIRCQTLDGYVCFPQDGQISLDAPLTDIDIGFAPFKKGTWRCYTSLDGLVNEKIFAIEQTSEGTLWLATMGGVSCFDGERFTNYTVRDGLPHNWMSAIHRDEDDTLWFGTASGLLRYNPPYGEGGFINFTPEDGLPNEWIEALHRTPDGLLWIGTGGGLACFDGKRFTAFTTDDGLLDDWISGIAHTADGRLWFGTDAGFSCFDGEAFRHYTTEDGLVDTMFSPE